MRTGYARHHWTAAVALLSALTAHVPPVAAATPKMKSSLAAGQTKLQPVLAPQTIVANDRGAAAEIQFENIGISGAETGEDEVEMTLRFDGALDGAQAEKLASALPRWIAYATPGYDSLLIRTRKKAAFSVTRSGTGFVLRIAWAADPAEASRENMQRLRLLTMTGETTRARALLADLRKLPAEGDRLDRAEAELRVAERDRRGGLAIYEQLAAANPSDLGLRRSVTELRKDLSDEVQIGLLRQSVEDGDTQTRLTLRGRADVGPVSAVRAELETVALQDNSVLRPDGVIESVDTAKTRLRASYDVEAGGGVIWSAVLHGGAPGLGIGGEVAWRGPKHDITLRAAYHEPFFGFVETIANDGARDGVEASIVLRGSRHWSAGATLGYNRYALDGIDEAAATTALDAFARYETPVSDRTTLIFAYTLDAEYVGDVAIRMDGLGAAFAPLPVSDREVHSLGVGVYAEWDGGISLDAMAGYAYDRYSEGGVFARASLDYEITQAWRAFASASYAEVNTRGTGGGAVTSGGIGLVYSLGAPGALFRRASQGTGS